MAYSVLEDRLLRYDGVNIVDPDRISNMFLYGLKPNQIIVTEINEDVEFFNQLSDIPIKEYNGQEPILDFSWKVPRKYLEIDLIDYFSKFITPENEERIAEELGMVYEMKVENEIKTIIYVISTLKEKSIMWGVGRGSSCASYLLFLIRVHVVDPIKYNIPYTEFFHA